MLLKGHAVQMDKSNQDDSVQGAIERESEQEGRKPFVRDNGRDATRCDEDYLMCVCATALQQQ